LGKKSFCYGLIVFRHAMKWVRKCWLFLCSSSFQFFQLKVINLYIGIVVSSGKLGKIIVPTIWKLKIVRKYKIFMERYCQAKHSSQTIWISLRGRFSSTSFWCYHLKNFCRLDFPVVLGPGRVFWPGSGWGQFFVAWVWSGQPTMGFENFP